MEEWLTILLSSIGGGGVGWLISGLTLNFNYKRLFAETVSQNRMDWMNIWRENLSILIGSAESIHNAPYYKDDKNFERPDGDMTEQELQDIYLYGDKNSPYVKYRNEFYKARNAIISRINMTEEKHVLMFGALNKFDFARDNENFETEKAYIIELARAILKPEWERLKREAKGQEK